MSRPLVVLLAVTLGAGTLTLIFWDRLAQASSGQIASVIAGLMALVIVLSGYGGLRRAQDFPRAGRDLLLWVAAGIALALFYMAARPYLPEDFGLR